MSARLKESASGSLTLHGGNGILPHAIVPPGHVIDAIVSAVLNDKLKLF
jgi:hypothetical protein